MRAHQNPLKAAWESLFNRIIGKNLVFILIEPLGRVHLSFFLSLCDSKSELADGEIFSQ